MTFRAIDFPHAAPRLPRRRRLPIAAAALPLVCLLSPEVRAAAAREAATAAQASAWHEDGEASYYAPRWKGRRTSSGEVFDPRKLTAAHASLPLGTRIVVTSETSGESVVVTVNDRQPDHGARIIDLSPAAAARLHMLGSGVARVEIAEAGPGDAAEDEEVAEAPDTGADDAIDAAAAPHHRRHHPVRTHHRR